MCNIFFHYSDQLLLGNSWLWDPITYAAILRIFHSVKHHALDSQIPTLNYIQLWGWKSYIQTFHLFIYFQKFPFRQSWLSFPAVFQHLEYEAEIPKTWPRHNEINQHHIRSYRDTSFGQRIRSISFSRIHGVAS